MRKFTILSLALTGCVAIGYTQSLEPDDLGGVGVLPNCYAHKLSHDGIQIVGETENGGTFYYNRTTGAAYYYEDCDAGKGYVISDAGWVVGTKVLDSDAQTNVAVIMRDGNISSPSVFNSYATSNIHSITPDGSRICGVVGPAPNGATNAPFYCDIDANGNFGQLQLLPTPAKDFFGASPQFVSVTWMSEDGSVIAGYVKEMRGLFNYPILYRQNEQGVWYYTYPSESLFNPENLEIPKPLGDFEEEYPGVEYPEVEKYISADKMEAWEEALDIWESNNFDDELDPYNHLGDYMTSEALAEYREAYQTYEICAQEYSEQNEKYWETLIHIADTSVLFVQNAMALSPNGEWLAASAEIPTNQDSTGIIDGEDMYAYVPYLFNLSNGEILKLDNLGQDLVTNQVLPEGIVISTTPGGSPVPPRSYVYVPSEDKMLPIQDYVAEVDPAMGNWMQEYLTGEVQVDVTEYKETCLTGRVSASKDFTTIVGGVLASAIGYEMIEMTYIMTGLPAGVEEIVGDLPANGLYTVYNLQGVKVMQTKDASLINSLSKGIYIVNGKKVVVK